MPDLSPADHSEKRYRILMLSSHTNPSTSGPVNHQIYAQKHGYDYLFDGTPYPLITPYDQKFWAILRAMERSNCDWIFWVDDDAYFMDLERGLENFIPSDNVVNFVFCKSPINLDGVWTLINSGLFFIRNNESSKSLLTEALNLPMKLVEEWWDEKKHGLFIPGGDQERMIYLFWNRDMVGKSVLIHDYDVFNSRAYHFKKTATDQFICHLASHRNKQVPLNEMRKRFKLDQYLISSKDAARVHPGFRYSVFSKEQPLPVPPGILFRIRRKARRLLEKLRVT